MRHWIAQLDTVSLETDLYGLIYFPSQNCGFVHKDGKNFHHFQMSTPTYVIKQS